MATAVGLAVGTRTLSAVRVDGNPKNWTVTAFHAEPLAERPEDGDIDPVTWSARAVDDFLRRHKLPRQNVHVALPPEHTILRQFVVPFRTYDQIKKTITFQAETHIHSVPIEQLELAFVKLEEFRSSSEVLVFAVHTDALRETLNSYRRLGWDPLGADTGAGAVLNAMLAHPTAKAPEVTLWCDIGPENSTLAVLRPVDEAQAQDHTIGSLERVRIVKLGIALPESGPIARPRTRSSIGDASLSAAARAAATTVPQKGGETDGETTADGDQTFTLPEFFGADGTPLDEATLLDEALPRNATAVLPGLTGPPATAVATALPATAVAENATGTALAETDELGAALADVVAAERDGPAAVLEALPAALAARSARAKADTAPLELADEVPADNRTLVISRTQVLGRPDTLVRRLALEIRRTLLAVDSDKPVTRVVVSGGGPALEAVQAKLVAEFPQLKLEFLPAGLGIANKLADPNVLQSHAQAFLVPYGMALKGLGINPLDLEFRRGEFTPGDAFEALRVPVAVGVTLLAAFFLVVFVFVLLNQKRLNRLDAEMYAEASKHYTYAYRTVKRRPTPPPTTAEIFDEMYGTYSAAMRKAAYKDLPKVRNALEVWRAMLECVAAHRREREFSITSMEVKDRGQRFELRGRVKDHRDGTRLRNVFRDRKELFQNVTIDISAVREGELTDRRGRVLDTRPKFTLKGDIIPLEPPRR